MVVLKGIPRILSPELLHVLAQMGHGDEIVLADANFPSSSICGAGPKEIRADGHGIPELLEAILQLLPLDAFVPSPTRSEENRVFFLITSGPPWLPSRYKLSIGGSGQFLVVIMVHSTLSQGVQPDFFACLIHYKLSAPV
ncbi:fucose mutarotase-like isoform X2 [Acanthaster planci]|uniref:L-fucose mutarotase n=1 Tax=Acanthaster planci TaxID=133434 RepID=A0A8B7XK87_ACAPL|nr:fucose mutarotase-like isoform X2 [Acanthaster planci]